MVKNSRICKRINDKTGITRRKKFYNKLSANFILAYGTQHFLNEMYPIILENFIDN